MTLLRSVANSYNRFMNTNVRGGELWKHKGGYLAAAIIGYLALHTLCGCSRQDYGMRRSSPGSAVEQAQPASDSLETRLIPFK